MAIGATLGGGISYQMNRELWDSRLTVVRSLEKSSGVKLITPIPQSQHDSHWDEFQTATSKSFARGWNSRVDAFYCRVEEATKDIEIPDASGALHSLISDIGKRNE